MDSANFSHPWEQKIIRLGTDPQMPQSRKCDAIGGDLGSECTDFEVTEIPAYLPSGQGDHVYLFVEKVGRSSQDAFNAIEKAFGVREIDVGYAGKKDVHAVTRQWFSVQTNRDPAPVIEELNAIPWLKVIESSRHTNKIHMGHLRANRFCARLYHVQAEDKAIETACSELRNSGFINYFGLQRFGFDGENVAHGIRVINGEKVRRQMLKMYVSAVQSAIFNLAAARRYAECGFDVFQGDVMQKQNGACFVCDDPETDRQRAQNGEIAATLSLPGKKYMHGNGFTETLEQTALSDFLHLWNETDDNAAQKLFRLADGTRRALWIRPNFLEFKRIDLETVSMTFELPPGCYATVMLHHLCGSSFSR